MAHRVVAIQVDLSGDDTILTAIGQSPRGTKFQLKAIEVKVPRQDKQAYETAVKAAIEDI